MGISCKPVGNLKPVLAHIAYVQALEKAKKKAAKKAAKGEKLGHDSKKRGGSAA